MKHRTSTALKHHNKQDGFLYRKKNNNNKKIITIVLNAFIAQLNWVG